LTPVVNPFDTSGVQQFADPRMAAFGHTSRRRLREFL